MFTNTPGSARFARPGVSITLLRIQYKYLYKTFWKIFLGKHVKCGTSHVYTTRCTKKGGVIGEPWFPIPIVLP